MRDMEKQLRALAVCPWVTRERKEGAALHVFSDGDTFAVIPTEHSAVVLRATTTDDDSPADVEAILIYAPSGARWLASMLLKWADAADAAERA